ncbi:MAG: mechanosensitive ion channel family protein [Deltaproteobacteria bacterium]|nr:mechanosensitive ion channel family protein [Deltaproteobacteria bacterium]
MGLTTSLIPVIILYFLLSYFPLISEFLRSLVKSYISLHITFIVVRLLAVGLSIYELHDVSKKRPLKGYTQLIIVFIYILGFITALSFAIKESPFVFLSGFGAITAVIGFVFKDTIMSFVASIQIAANDLIRVGDWVEVPEYGADGDILDISLHHIKIQNFDKTISFVPTSKIVDTHFKNWRGMDETGGRRIKRSIYIDQTSINFADIDLLNKLKQSHLLNKWLIEKLKEIEDANKNINLEQSIIFDGRRLTNLGLFRAYLVEYLKSRNDLRKELTFMVRHLDPTPNGLPIQVYIFTNNTEWVSYENIQADIFDHILATITHFDLKVFQNIIPVTTKPVT